MSFAILLHSCLITTSHGLRLYINILILRRKLYSILARIRIHEMSTNNVTKPTPSSLQYHHSEVWLQIGWAPFCLLALRWWAQELGLRLPSVSDWKRFCSALPGVCNKYTNNIWTRPTKDPWFKKKIFSLSVSGILTVLYSLVAKSIGFCESACSLFVMDPDRLNIKHTKCILKVCSFQWCGLSSGKRHGEHKNSWSHPCGSFDHKIARRSCRMLSRKIPRVWLYKCFHKSRDVRFDPLVLFAAS